MTEGTSPSKSVQVHDRASVGCEPILSERRRRRVDHLGAERVRIAAAARHRRSSASPKASPAKDGRGVRGHAPYRAAPGAADLAAGSPARTIVDTEAHPVEVQVLGLHPGDSRIGHLDHQDVLPAPSRRSCLRSRRCSGPGRPGADHRDEAGLLRPVRIQALATIIVADPSGELGVMGTIPGLIEPIGFVQLGVRMWRVLKISTLQLCQGLPSGPST